MKGLRNLLLAILLIVTPAFGGHTTTTGAYCEGTCTAGRCSNCGQGCSDGGRAATQEMPKPELETAPDLGMILIFVSIYLGIRPTK